MVRPSHRRRTVGWLALATAAALVSAARGVTASLAMVHPIQAAGMFAALAFLLASRPGARELLVFLVAAAVFAWAHPIWFGLFHFRGVPVPQTLLLALGFGSLAALASRVAASPRDDAAWEWLHWGIILPSFGMVMDLCLDLTITLHPRVWDPVLFRLDAALGQPSFVLGRVGAMHPGALTLLSLVYLFLPVVMAAVIATERTRVERGREVLNVILAAGAAGYLLYNLYPVIGPSSLFGAAYPFGPAALLSGASRTVDVGPSGDPRNCMPSLHASWALLLYWHSRWLGMKARAGCAAWLLATVLATLMLGQHYLVDLVVAVPFAALIDALVSVFEPTEIAAGRRTAIAVDAGLLFFWYAILFWAPAGLERGPAMPLLAAATVLPAWALHARWAAPHRPSVARPVST